MSCLFEPIHGRFPTHSICDLYPDCVGCSYSDKKKPKTFCDTCGNQFSDVCGTCETLEGVPVKYTSDKAVMLPNLEEFMEQFKVVDTDHVYSNGVEFVPIFRVKQWIEYQKSKKRTNADRIRNMTDEEMADWLIMNGDGSDYETWLAWLKQEADT